MDTIISILIVVFGVSLVLQNITNIIDYYFKKQNNVENKDVMNVISMFDMITIMLLFYEIYKTTSENQNSWLYILYIILFFFLVTSFWKYAIQKWGRKEKER